MVQSRADTLAVSTRLKTTLGLRQSSPILTEEPCDLQIQNRVAETGDPLVFVCFTRQFCFCLAVGVNNVPEVN